jgi:outer membrane protein assembly factor BamB
LNAQTGGIDWTFRTSETITGKGIWSTPLVTNGRIYFGGYDGNVYCLAAASGDEVWRFTEADWVGSSPHSSTDGKSVFVGLEYARPGRRGGLAALDAATGAKRWEVGFGDFVHCSPCYVESANAIGIGSNANDFAFVDAASGEIRWRSMTAGPIKAAAAYDPDRAQLLVGSFDGIVHCLDEHTGRRNWVYATDNAIYSTPLIVKGRAFICSTDKHLHVVDLDERRCIRKLNIGSKLFSSPRLLRHAVVFGSNAGAVYHVDPDSLEILARYTLPERVTNAISYSQPLDLFLIQTLDNRVHALRLGGFENGPNNAVRG